MKSTTSDTTKSTANNTINNAKYQSLALRQNAGTIAQRDYIAEQLRIDLYRQFIGGAKND